MERISNLDILRAASWGTLGSTLLLFGGGVGGVLGAVGASAHLWGDDAFLAGFALSCLVCALGGYALVAVFFGGIGPIALPLPRLKFEREAKRRAGRQPLAHAGTPDAGSGRGDADGADGMAGERSRAGGSRGDDAGQGVGVVLPLPRTDDSAEPARARSQTPRAAWGMGARGPLDLDSVDLPDYPDFNKDREWLKRVVPEPHAMWGQACRSLAQTAEFKDASWEQTAAATMRVLIVNCQEAA